MSVVRRLTLIFTLLIVFLLVAVPQSAPAQEQPPINQMRAFWADTYHDGFRNHPQVDALVETVARAGGNTIIMQVRRHGDAWYNQSFEPHAVEPSLAPAAEFDPLQYMLDKAHSMGIKVHAWIVLGPVCPASDPVTQQPTHVCVTHGPRIADPERWTTATFSGKQVSDLDFGHPSAVQYLERVVQNLLQNYPSLDGIHWDYVRYAGPEYGYNQVSIDRFNGAYNRPGGSRPDPYDPLWAQWRRDRVTEVVRRLYIRSKAINPQIQVSAATITWGGAGSETPESWPKSAAYGRVFQDWRAWLEEGILDFAVPMHYFAEGKPQQRDWYNSWLAWDHQHTGKRAIVPGMGAWLNNADEVMAQTQRALAPDATGQTLAGVAFYSYDQPLRGGGNAPRRAFADRLRNEIFAPPAVAPQWPWMTNPTTGMIQGIATIDGQVMPSAAIMLIRDGVWQSDLTAAVDGWYGAVELPPGNYTVIIRDPANSERTNVQQLLVVPGHVASA